MGAKILLATADSANMAKLEMALGPRGHQVDSVRSLTEAFNALEADATYDAVICDLLWAIGDSFELLQHTRADHLRNTIAFIFLVEEQGLLTESLRKVAAIHGADKFIFMDEFDAHRIRCEIEALLPEQIASPRPAIEPFIEPQDVQPQAQNAQPQEGIEENPGSP